MKKQRSPRLQDRHLIRARIQPVCKIDIVITALTSALNQLDRFPLSSASFEAWNTLRANLFDSLAFFFWLRGHFHYQRACPSCRRAWRVTLDDLAIEPQRFGFDPSRRRASLGIARTDAEAPAMGPEMGP